MLLVLHQHASQTPQGIHRNPSKSLFLLSHQDNQPVFAHNEIEGLAQVLVVHLTHAGIEQVLQVGPIHRQIFIDVQRLELHQHVLESSKNRHFRMYELLLLQRGAFYHLTNKPHVGQIGLGIGNHLEMLVFLGSSCILARVEETKAFEGVANNVGVFEVILSHLQILHFEDPGDYQEVFVIKREFIEDQIVGLGELTHKESLFERSEEGIELLSGHIFEVELFHQLEDHFVVFTEGGADEGFLGGFDFDERRGFGLGTVLHTF